MSYRSRDNRQDGHRQSYQKPNRQFSYPDGGFKHQAAPKVFTLLDLLTRLGDAREPPSRTTAAELVAAVSTQADAVKIEVMDDEKKEKLVSHLLKCIVALPTKTALYGTLIGLVSADIPTLSDEILRKTNEELTLSLQRRDFHSIKYLVRFVAELHNARVISSGLVTKLLNIFASNLPQSTSDMESYGNPQNATDFLAYVVMTTLLFVGEPVASDSGVMKPLEKYFSLRQELPLNIFDDTRQSHDFLASLWSHVQDHATRGWPYLQTVSKPWQDDVLQQQLMKNEESRHDDTTQWLLPFCDDTAQLRDLLLGRLSTSGSHQNEEDVISGLRKETEIIERQFVPGGKVASLVGPRSSLRVLKTIPSSSISNIERWAFEDYVIDTFHFFQVNTEEAARQLLNMPYHATVTPSAAYEDLLAEAVFSELLRLPEPPHNFVLYSVVLCKLCVLFPDFPPALADVTNALFSSSSTLAVSSFVKLVDWFANHLSNFDYAWDWSDWATSLARPDGSIDANLTRQNHFIREVMQRCIRLSYYERLEKSVPVSFIESGLLPPRPSANDPFGNNDEVVVDPRVAAAAGEEARPVEVSSRPQLKRPTEAAFFSLQISKDLVDAIVHRKPEEEMAELLDKAQTELRAEEIIELMVRAVIMAGSKTPTHLQHALDRMLPALFGFTYGGDDASARHEKANKAEGELIVSAVWKHLHNSPQHLLLCMLKMLHAELISPKNVLDFLLRDSTLGEHGHDLFLWELVDQTIRMTLEKAKLIALKLLHASTAEEKAQLESQLTRYHKKLRAALVHVFSRAASAVSAHAATTENMSYDYHFVLGAVHALGRKYFRYMKETIDVLLHTAESAPAMAPIVDEIKYLSTHF